VAVKIAYSLPEAAEMTSQSLDTLALAHQRGELTKSYFNSKPTYTHKELERWTDSLKDTPQSIKKIAK